MIINKYVTGCHSMITLRSESVDERENVDVDEASGSIDDDRKKSADDKDDDDDKDGSIMM